MTVPVQRVVWLDSARGLAVLGVVLLHVCLVGYWPFAPSGGSTDTWNRVVSAMWPYRLPMLFAVSGILASGAIQQGWGSAKPRRMIAKGLWLYLVWQLIYTGLGVAGVDMWSP